MQKLKLNGVSLVKSNENLVDVVWRDNGKPDPPVNEVFIHPLKYSGKCPDPSVLSVRWGKNVAFAFRRKHSWLQKEINFTKLLNTMCVFFGYI